MDRRNSKYNRTIKNLRHIDGERRTQTVDVYSVLDAFDVRCAATAHAIKKLLCAGLRGKCNAKQDLGEAIQAIERAIDAVVEDPETGIFIAADAALSDSSLEYQLPSDEVVQSLSGLVSVAQAAESEIATGYVPSAEVVTDVYQADWTVAGAVGCIDNEYDVVRMRVSGDKQWHLRHCGDYVGAYDTISEAIEASDDHRDRTQWEG